MKIRFYLTIGILFLFAGSLVGSQYALTAGQQANVQPSAPISSNEPNKLGTPEGAKLSGTPIFIAIPSVKIEVGVEQGTYDPVKKSWTLGETKPSYATMTALPNTQGGDTFIYGHNRVGVFANLLDVKPGARAIITTSNGHRFTYELSSIRDVKPSDTSLFDYHGAPILTLQTCSGLFYQNRHLVTFKLVEAV